MLENDFKGYLTRMVTKTKDNNVFMNFVITYIEKGPFTDFLNDYAKVFKEENITSLFDNPIQWKNIRLDANRNMAIKFDNLDILAKLTSINIRRALKKNGDIFYTYNFTFENEFDPDNTPVLMHFLNQKGEDVETGKKKKIDFDISITSALK